jgi:hypothetical protein
LGLLPFQTSRSGLLTLLGDVLSVHTGIDYNAKLRLRLIDKNISWQALLEFAQHQGVLWALIWSLQRRSLLLPLPASDDANSRHPSLQLVSAYREHLARRERQRDQLLALVGGLNRAKLKPLLLKGARLLVSQPDPWVEARDLRDIDLLVHPQDAESAVATLGTMGYAVDDSGAPVDQHLPEMWQTGQPSVVEIHTHALSFSARKLLPTDEIWRRAIPMLAGGCNFFVMPLEWHLLHAILSHQISDRGHIRQILAAKPLWEFTMSASAVAAEGWLAIAKHLVECGQVDVLGSWIVQAEKLYSLSPPPNVAISPVARAHAAATLANAVLPGWLRQASRIVDEFRFAFARETLAARYRIDVQDVSLATRVRHLKFLRRYYRGRVTSRLFGARSPP